MEKRSLWIRTAIIVTIVLFTISNAFSAVTGTATATPSTISAGQTSQLNCTGSGGTGTYYYSWSSVPPGFNSKMQNPVVAPNVTTVYTCQIFNGGQYGYSSVTVTVSGVSSFSATATATPSSITSGQTSQLNCNPTGGSGIYTYAWTSNPAGFTSTLKNPVVSPTVNTTYNCTVTSGTQTATASATVTVTSLLNATLTATPQTINAGQTSQLNCNATGGTGTYTYSWTSDPVGFTSTLRNPTVSPSDTTSYICHVTSGTQGLTLNILVNVSAAATVTVTATPNTTIAGQNVQLNAAPSGGTGTYSYAWTSNPSGFSSILRNPVVTPQVNTTYTCVVTSGVQTCTGNAAVTVTPVLTATANATPASITSGQTSQLNCTPVGGTGTYTYSWTSSPAGFTSTLRNPVVSPLATTTYTCAVTSGLQSITTTTSVTVGSAAALTATATANPMSVTAGQNSTLNCSATGGTGTYTYSWTSVPAGFVSSQSSPVVSPSVTTTYNCVVSSGTQTANASVTVTVAAIPALTATTTATPSSITSGQSSTLNCIPSGGTGTYTYSWTSDPSGFTSSQKSPVVSPTFNTTYTCAVTSGTQSASSSVIVSVTTVTSLNITTTATPSTITAGQTSQLNCSVTGSTSSYNYSWTSNPAGFTSSLQNPVVSPVANTTYTCSVTSGGLTGTGSVSVTVNSAAFNVTVKANPGQIASGQSSQLTCTATGGSGNYTYSWVSSPAGFSSTLMNPVVKPRKTTTYTVTVNDGISSQSASVKVHVNGWIKMAVALDNTNSDPLCKGQSTQVSANATGGMGTYNYSWSSIPEGFTSFEKDIEITPEHSMRLICEVSDGDSAVIATSDIIVNPAPNAVAGPDVEVKSTEKSVSLTGTASNYSNILWTSDGDGIFSDPNSLTGEYTPGPADLVKGSAKLTLTANAAAPCTETISSTKTLSFSTTTSIPDPSGEKYNVSVYPNPTPGIVHVHFDGNVDSDATVTLIDVQGKVLQTREFRISEGGEISFDLSSYSTGIYFVKIQAGELTKTHKIIHN